MKKIYLNKAKTQIARPETIRRINRQIVLTYFRDSKYISRAEIARRTTLNRSTVSSIIDSLLSDGVIEDFGIGDSSGGRKPNLLKLKSDKPVALGIDITPKVTTIAVSDLSGRILQSEFFDTISDREIMTNEIITRVTSLVKAFDKSDLGIGISVPGITDNMNGNVHYVPYFQWRDWDIARQLSKAVNLNVTIENDANASALAELWFGKKKIREFRNIITILVGEGIGTGIIFEGEIYRGEQGAAGEFGHMIVGDNSLVECSCGSRNCWEALASENATVAQYLQYASITNDSKTKINFEKVVSLALAGDDNACRALKQTGKYLGIGISNLIVGLSPQAIVISGSIVEAWDIISDELFQLLANNNRIGLETTPLITSTLGSHPTLIGALNLVLAKKFASF